MQRFRPLFYVGTSGFPVSSGFLFRVASGLVCLWVGFRFFGCFSSFFRSFRWFRGPVCPGFVVRRARVLSCACVFSVWVWRGFGVSLVFRSCFPVFATRRWSGVFPMVSGVVGMVGFACSRLVV